MNTIKVQDVRKRFKVYYDKSLSIKERILFWRRNRYEERWVLQGITFEASKGDVIGLIGENGCGKSTLLKLMSKIMYPDIGSIKIQGRVSSLIELGAGFHPDMSGRENIYTNAAIFGLKRWEIEERLEAIIAFSELGEYIDNPVRTYSSGMYMRLAFSVAINVDADVLLIDEILAVGDANFQAKCFDHLRRLKADGVTIVIVTHDIGMVERFCTQALWLQKGIVASRGPSYQVVDEYMMYMNEKKLKMLETKADGKEEAQQEQLQDVDTHAEQDKVSELERLQSQAMDYNVKHFGLNYAQIIKAWTSNETGELTTAFKHGTAFVLTMEYEVHKPSSDGYVFGMGLYTMEGAWVTGTNTRIDRVSTSHLPDRGRVQFWIDKLPLLTGQYILQISITDINGTPMDFYRNYSIINVVATKNECGIISIPHRWELN